MKNRQKLTDDQLDAVSGGDTMREDAERSKMLDQNLCPLCGRELFKYFDTIMFYKCSRCNVEWTNYHGYWERYVTGSSGC